MQMYLDNIIFALQRAGGISVYWSELIRRFIRDCEDVRFIERESALKNMFRASVAIPGERIENETVLPTAIGRYLPPLVGIPRGALFHSSYYRVPIGGGCVNVQTAYDFTYERFREGPARWVHSWQKRTAISRADGVICISESTRRDLAQLFPDVALEKLRVIYLGISSDFHRLEKHEVGDWDLPSGKFAVFVGDRSWYKNFGMTVEAVALLGDCALVIVGGGDLLSSERELLEARLGRRYKALGRVPNSKLNEIYNAAHALIYPSSYEGFGIPVVEAMAAGCPVVAANVSSIPEAAGDAGLLVSELTAEALAGEISRLDDGALRSALVERGLRHAQRFSWERCYRETLSFYSDVRRAAEVRGWRSGEQGR